MPNTRKNLLLQWASDWPVFLIVFGIVAVFIWAAVLGWLITKAFALII